MSRSADLLRLAAQALDDMRDPFDHSFLVEHAVTADECFTLSTHLALGARMYLRANAELHAGGILGQVGASRIVAALMDTPEAPT